MEKKCGCTDKRLCGMHRGAAYQRQALKHGKADPNKPGYIILASQKEFDPGWDKPAPKDSDCIPCNTPSMLCPRHDLPSAPPADGLLNNRAGKEERRRRAFEEMLKELKKVNDGKWCHYHGRPSKPACDDCSITRAIKQAEEAR